MASLPEEHSCTSPVGGEAVGESGDTVVVRPFEPGQDALSVPTTPSFLPYKKPSRGSGTLAEAPSATPECPSGSTSWNAAGSGDRMKGSDGSPVIAGEAAAAAGQGSSTAGLWEIKGSPVAVTTPSTSSTPKTRAAKSSRRKKKSATAGHSPSGEPSSKGVAASKEGKAASAEINDPFMFSSQKSFPSALPASGNEGKEKVDAADDIKSDGEEELCGICLEKPPLEGFVRLWCCNNVLCVKDAQHIGRCPFCRTEPLVWDIEK